MSSQPWPQLNITHNSSTDEDSQSSLHKAAGSSGCTWNLLGTTEPSVALQQIYFDVVQLRIRAK